MHSGLHPKISTAKMPTGVDRGLSMHNVCVLAVGSASHFAGCVMHWRCVRWERHSECSQGLINLHTGRHFHFYC